MISFWQLWLEKAHNKVSPETFIGHLSYFFTYKCRSMWDEMFKTPPPKTLALKHFLFPGTPPTLRVHNTCKGPFRIVSTIVLSKILFILVLSHRKCFVLYTFCLVLV